MFIPSLFAWLLFSSLAVPNWVQAMTPSAAHNCCSNPGLLRFGMLPLDFAPIVKYNGMKTLAGNVTEPYFSGFLPEVMQLLVADMGMQIEWHIIACPMTPEYDNCAARLVNEGSLDMVFNTASILQKDVSRDLFITQAIYEATQMALIRRVAKGSGWWQLFQPFTLDLWLGVVASIAFASAVICIIELLLVDVWIESFSPALMFKAVYHSWVAVLGGDDFEWTNWPGRIFRVGLLFLVLVIGATYTANLASFLTRPAFDLVGPQDIKALSDSTVCVSYEYWGDAFSAYASTIIFPEDPDLSLSGRLDWCNEKIQSGDADVILENDGSLRKYMLSHCEDLAWVPTISFGRDRWMLVVSGSKKDLAHNFSSAITHMVQQPEYDRILADTLNVGLQCQAAENDSGEITLESMAGLFVIFGVVSVCAISAAVVQRVKQKRQPAAHRESSRNGSDPLASEADMLREVLQKLDTLQSAISEQQQEPVVHMVV